MSEDQTTADVDVLVRAKAGAVLAARVRDQFGHAEAPYTPWALEALADYDATTAGADEPDDQPEPERTKLTVDVEALAEHYGPAAVAAEAARLAHRPDLADRATITLMAEAIKTLATASVTDRAEHRDIVEALGMRCVTLEQQTNEWRAGLVAIQQEMVQVDEREKKRRDEHHVRVSPSTVRPGLWTSRCSCGHDIGQGKLSTLGEQLGNLLDHLNVIYG